MTTAGASMASLRWGSQAVARAPSGFVHEAWADGPRGLGWSMPPTRARVSPHTPGHAIHGGSSSVTISSVVRGELRLPSARSYHASVWWKPGSK